MTHGDITEQIGAQELRVEQVPGGGQILVRKTHAAQPSRAEGGQREQCQQLRVPRHLLRFGRATSMRTALSRRSLPLAAT